MTVAYTLAALVVLANVAALGAVIYANWCHHTQSGPSRPAPMMGDAGIHREDRHVGGPSPVPPSEVRGLVRPRTAGRFDLHAARNAHRD